MIKLKKVNQTITLDLLKIYGRLRRLTCELRIIVEFDANHLTLSNDAFGLLVSAPPLEEGIVGISDELSRLWEVYVDENPANLTQNALLLRSNLESLVAAGVFS